MNILYSYINTIFYYDCVNKFNCHKNSNKILKIKTLIASITFKSYNLKRFVKELLVLKLFFSQKIYFDSKQLDNKKKRGGFLMKTELRNKNFEVNLLKFIWLLSNNLNVDKKNSKKKKTSSTKKILTIKLNNVKILESFIDSKLIKKNNIQLNCVFENSSRYDRNQINFFYKSLKLCA